MHFAESRANLLTNDAGDAVTGTGEYKVCAVRVEKITATNPAGQTVAAESFTPVFNRHEQ